MPNIAPRDRSLRTQAIVQPVEHLGVAPGAGERLAMARRAVSGREMQQLPPPAQPVVELTRLARPELLALRVRDQQRRVDLLDLVAEPVARHLLVEREAGVAFDAVRQPAEAH